MGAGVYLRYSIEVEFDYCIEYFSGINTNSTVSEEIIMVLRFGFKSLLPNIGESKSSLLLTLCFMCPHYMLHIPKLIYVQSGQLIWSQIVSSAYF